MAQKRSSILQRTSRCLNLYSPSQKVACRSSCLRPLSSPTCNGSILFETYESMQSYFPNFPTCYKKKVYEACLKLFSSIMRFCARMLGNSSHWEFGSFDSELDFQSVKEDLEIHV
ncbi:hypothetical protein CEXT_322751 [Caerostris extrusa]|uniref:Uncharacterized protein n=1 Tax=Caerostris extrusa TaxID=172846 RepID=A0AAV4MTI4_CAEEX|nr:hypothetical protein CEXT_322751 [Caerostris extrusa]